MRETLYLARRNYRTLNAATRAPATLDNHRGIPRARAGAAAAAAAEGSEVECRRFADSIKCVRPRLHMGRPMLSSTPHRSLINAIDGHSKSWAGGALFEHLIRLASPRMDK